MSKWITGFLLVAASSGLTEPILSEIAPARELAQAKYEEGDYNASRDLCEEILKRNPSDQVSVELLAKSKTQLESLARDHYVHGAMLESLNRLEEAKQYWNRALTYVRPGEKYHEWTTERLSHYH